METPSSSRRITRSQTRSTMTNNDSVSMNREEAEKKASKMRPKSALIDITNDSPIVGLAGKSIFSESKTPSSCVSKQRRNVPKSTTPGSGEALLRGQVKTLLQKVEEEAHISRFLGSIRPQFLGQTLSPMAILAPTPANTPQLLGSIAQQQHTTVHDFATEIPIQEEDHLQVSQIVNDLFDVKSCLITRSLLLDFSEKSESSTEGKSSSSLSDCSSAVTYQLSEDVEEEEEEDASVWSIQVNASSRDEDEDAYEDMEPEEEEEHYEEEEEDEEVECDDDDGFMDELCAGISKISVGEIRFEGKHTRFMYNNENEIEKEEEVVHLKGLPTPNGKHLRFAEEEEED